LSLKPRSGGPDIKPKHILEIDQVDLILQENLPPSCKDGVVLMNAGYARRERQDRMVTYIYLQCGTFRETHQLMWDEQELLTTREDADWIGILQNITGSKSKYVMVGGNPESK
jgi:hypothetical protein